MNYETVDGKPVIPGLFKLYDTHGLPLSLACNLIYEHDAAPNWLEFVLDAKKSGWSDKKIMSLCHELSQDCEFLRGTGFSDRMLNLLYRLEKLSLKQPQP